jgi:hypothetical protein
MKENLIDNCLGCMFSEYSEINIMFNDLTDSNFMKCKHENSPYYGESVNEEYSCRQFLDSNKYFLKKDRKDKLDNLKNK